MALSYLDNAHVHQIGHYRTKKFGDGRLLVNDYGFWVFLTNSEYELLRKNRLHEDSGLLSLLENNGFILDRTNVDNFIHKCRTRMMNSFNGTNIHSIIVNDEESKEPITEDTTKKITDFVFQSPSQEINIEFVGNDPLLSFNTIKSIVELANRYSKYGSKRITYSLRSNFHDFKDDHLDFFIINKINLWANLYPGKNLYNNQMDLELIKKINRVYSINGIGIIGRKSLSKDLLDFCINAKINNLFLKKSSECSYAEFFDFWKSFVEDRVESSTHSDLKELLTCSMLDRTLNLKPHYYFSAPPFFNPIGRIVYNYDGKIYPEEDSVGMEIFEFGDVSQSYREFLRNEQVINFARASLNENMVADVNAYSPYYSPSCVKSYIETGNVIERFPNERWAFHNKAYDYLFDKMLFDEKYREVFFKWAQHRH